MPTGKSQSYVNHQKSVSKAQETQLENIGSKLERLKQQKKQLKGILKLLNGGDTKKIPLKKDEKKLIESVNKAVAKAKMMKEKAVTKEEKIAATEATESSKQKKRDLSDIKFKQAHLWEKIPTKDQVIKRIQNWNTKITKMEMDLKHKDDNKEVALGTSKVCMLGLVGNQGHLVCRFLVSLTYALKLLHPHLDQLYGSKNFSGMVQEERGSY